MAASLDKKINAESEKLIKQINDYGARISDEGEKKVLDEAKLGVISFVTKLRQVGALASAGEPQMALGVVQKDIGPIHLRLSRYLIYASSTSLSTSWRRSKWRCQRTRRRGRPLLPNSVRCCWSKTSTVCGMTR